MTFFINFFKAIFIYFILICLATIITSFVYYRHDVEEKINSFYAYDRDYIHINISFFDKKKSSYLLAYTFYYYDKYKKKIELLDIDNHIIVVVNDDQGDITYASNKDLTTSTI